MFRVVGYKHKHCIQKIRQSCMSQVQRNTFFAVPVHRLNTWKKENASSLWFDKNLRGKSGCSLKKICSATCGKCRKRCGKSVCRPLNCEVHSRQPRSQYAALHVYSCNISWPLRFSMQFYVNFSQTEWPVGPTRRITSHMSAAPIGIMYGHEEYQICFFFLLAEKRFFKRRSFPQYSQLICDTLAQTCTHFSDIPTLHARCTTELV